MPIDRLKFQETIFSIADATKVFGSVKFASMTPKQITASLGRIDKALTSALQVLLPLQLQYREGQDLETEPFNWPIVQELSGSRITLEIMRRRGVPEASFEVPTYPTKLINDLIEMRDAARHAADTTKPSRGNSAKRNPRPARIDVMGRNFVFQYRAWFGYMPPITKTGWVVELLAAALDRAGVTGADAADVLRRAIERDVIGRSLPKKRRTK